MKSYIFVYVYPSNIFKYERGEKVVHHFSWLEYRFWVESIINQLPTNFKTSLDLFSRCSFNDSNFAIAIKNFWLQSPTVGDLPLIQPPFICSSPDMVATALSANMPVKMQPAKFYFMYILECEKVQPYDLHATLCCLVTP